MHACMYVLMHVYIHGWMYVHVHIYRLGEMCSDVAALLFEACVQLGIASMTSTSLSCIWNQLKGDIT